MNDIEQALKELKTLIGDNTPTEYMAKLIEKVEQDEIALRKAEINLGLLKQMNNRARVLLSLSGRFENKQVPFQNGIGRFILDTLSDGKEYLHKEIIKLCIDAGYTDGNARNAISKLTNHGKLIRGRKGRYVLSNSEDDGEGEREYSFAIPKAKILKLLYLAYPTLNIQKLADAIGISQPSVQQMIFK